MPGRRHRPHRYSKRPKPAPVTLRYVDGVEPKRLDTAMATRHREEARWHVSVSEEVSWDLWDTQRLLALQKDDTVTVPEYTGDVWGFVVDVNGPDKAITADTLLFDRPFERTFPFRMVVPRPLEGWDEEVESWVSLDRLNQLRGRERGQRPSPPLAEAA